MKKLFIILLILVVLTAGVLGFALLNANKLIAQFKPQLEQSISSFLGVAVEFQDISASILPETALKVSGLKIKDSSEPGPSFEQFSLKLKLKSLLGGKLDITRIELSSPNLTAIKETSGIRLKGFPIKQFGKKPPEASLPSVEGKAAAREGDTTAQLPIEINLEGFELTNGALIFEDKVANQIYSISDLNISTKVNLSGKTVTAQALNVNAKVLNKFPIKFSTPQLILDKSSFSVSAFTASLDRLEIQGGVNLDLATLKGEAGIHSTGIEIQDIVTIAENFIPNLSQFGLKGKVAPVITVNLAGPNTPISADIDIGISGVAAKQGIFTVSDLAGDITVQALLAPNSLPTAEAKSENLNLVLNGQAIGLKFLTKLAGTDINISNFTANLLNGSVSGNLALALNAEKSFSASVKGGGISIEPALAIVQMQATKLSGTVDSLESNITGRLGPDLMTSLRGNTLAKVSNGEIKGFNLAGIVLKAVNNLPFLTGSLYGSVPSSEQGNIDTSNTAFKTLDANISFDGGIRVNKVNLLAQIFSLEADGRLGFDTSLDLASTIFFDARFSEALVGRVPQLKNILDDQNRLVIPLKIQGTPPLVLVYPNVKKLLEVAGKRVLVDQAGKAVQGILDKKGLGGVGKLFGF